MNVTKSSDMQFMNVIGKYGITSVGNVFDYFFYENQAMPKGYSHTQQEIQENFNKTLDDMINAVYKVKLLTGNLYTHIAFAVAQGGQKGEVFRVVGLGTKKQLSVDGIIYCLDQQESGFILGGKIRDIQIKPSLVLINRGSQNQIPIGPNRIQYSQEMGEFRVQIPENYNGVNLSQVLGSNQSFNLIEIMITDANNNSFQYGQGYDLPLNFNQYQNLDVGFSDIIQDLSTIEQRQVKLSIAFGQAQLFQKSSGAVSTGFQRVSNNRPTMTTSTSSAPQVRTTRAQMMRQQTAQMKNSHSNNGNIQIYAPPNNQNTATNMNNMRTPSFNRSQTMTIGANNNHANMTMTSNRPSYINNTFGKNENQNPNVVMNFPANNSNNFNKPQVNFQNQQPIKFQFSQGAFQQPNNQANNPFTQGQKPQFAQNQQQNQQFQFNFNSNNSSFRPPTQQNFQQINQQQFSTNQNQFSQNQQNRFQNNSFNPNFNTQSNFSQPMNYQNQQTVVIQPTLKFGNNNNQQNSSQSGFHPQFNPNQNSYPQQQQQIFSNNFWGNLPDGLVFSQLSLIDQETLKSYLKDLTEVLNEEQMKKIQALMLTDPKQFVKYFQAAHEQFQNASTGSNKGNSKRQDLPEIGSKNQQDQQSQKQFSIKDYDDLTLFLLNIPKSLTKNNEVKFEFFIQQLKMGEITPQKLLKKFFIRKRTPTNESFKKMFESKQHSDLILCLRGEEFLCHQIVFTCNSEYFKKAIKESEVINKYQFGIEGQVQQKLIVPKWMDVTAFKLFILFMYTGHIGKDGDYTQLSPQDLMNLLKIGNYFFIECLQETIIVDILIPSMNHTTAALFLKECLQNDENHKKSCLVAWDLLKTYCMYYLQRHLPQLLRTQPQLIYDIDISLLRGLIDKALFFIIDGNKDLECLLQFTADTWANGNITRLFKQSQCFLESCSAFDFQLIPQMSMFLKQIDPKIDYSCQLIKGENPTFNRFENQTKVKEIEIKEQLESTFVAGASTKSQHPNQLDLSKWRPNCNVLSGIDAKEIFDTKDPQFQTMINLESIKQDFEKNKGCSIISKAFDFGRRSWHLKVDVDLDKNVSLWIVERGSTLQLITKDQENMLTAGNSIPYQFSSVIIQFEITDPAVGDFTSTVFFSFAHESNQTIGHQNFINIQQLQNKGELNLKIYMKEFILHSALTHYISSNFQDLYKKDIATVESNNKVQQNGNTYNKSGVYKDYEIFDLPFYNAFQILSSNSLRVDDENSVLGYIFYTTKVQSLNNSDENMKFISNLLSQTIRFYYVSSKKILSSLRDNEFLRASSVFINKTAEEFNARIQNSSSLVLNINTTSSKTQTKPQPRKYYDPSLITAEGRRKFDTSKDKIVTSQFIDELMDWLQTSKHKKDGDNMLYQEIRKWQNLYYEEKSKNIKLMSQKPQSPVYRDYQQRKSFSNDKRYQQQHEQVVYNPTLQRAQTNVPAFLRGRSPQKENQNYRGAAQPTRNRLNHSFDQREYINDSMKVQPNSTFRADGKIRTNQNLDFSMLLSELNRSGKKEQYGQQQYYSQRDYYNNQQNQIIPYYKQKKQANNQGNGIIEECRIF